MPWGGVDGLRYAEKLFPELYRYTVILYHNIMCYIGMNIDYARRVNDFASLAAMHFFFKVI